MKRIINKLIGALKKKPAPKSEPVPPIEPEKPQIISKLSDKKLRSLTGH